MDSIIQLVKDEIKAQYKTLSKFSEASGIPYSTLSNALTKGLGGTSYDTVIKIFTMLNLRQAFDDDIVLFNKEFHDIYSMLTQLDEKGVHTVCAVLNAEYSRCLDEQGEGKVKGFNGIGYATAPAAHVDEQRLMQLVEKVKKK